MMKPTADEVRALLICDAATGRLFWKARPVTMFSDDEWHTKEARCQTWNNRFAGKEAGSVSKYGKLKGYRLISIYSRPYLAHHIIWLIVHGFWPEQIDHKLGIENGDAIKNLRLATSAQNTQNSRIRSDNTSGFKGVSWTVKNRKWRAIITVEGRRISLGLFNSKEEAALAYRRAAQHHFGEFARFW